MTVIYIQKSWKPARGAALNEATNQALDVAREQARGAQLPLAVDRVRFNGRTYHDTSDWAFEFEYEITDPPPPDVALIPDGDVELR